MDKKEPGSEVRPAKVGKDNNSWQERKKRKKDKHVHEKFEPKPNNAPKGRKPKAWEARKPPVCVLWMWQKGPHEEGLSQSGKCINS